MLSRCLGYCFGAPFAIDLAATNLVVAGMCFLAALRRHITWVFGPAALAHPAFLSEDQFKNLKSRFLCIWIRATPDGVLHQNLCSYPALVRIMCP
jgi:hypothetical protein